MTEKFIWLIIRDDKVIQVYDTREKAISYFKDLLKQTLKDLDKQDKIKEYDYQIKIPKIEIIKTEPRETFLGL